MSFTFTGTRASSHRGPIINRQSNVVRPSGAPIPPKLGAAGPPKNPDRSGKVLPMVARATAPAFNYHATARPRLTPQTLTQKVGNSAVPSNTQTRLGTGLRRQMPVRRTPGRIPNGAIRSTSTSAGDFIFLSPAGRSTVTGVVHRPPQPLIPVLAARIKKTHGGMFGE